MLLFGGLLSQEGAPSLPWQSLAVVLQAVYFATLHVAAGFPSGASGGVLVFIWAVFLGILRLWSGGMLLVFLLHIQADVVIFVLIYMQEMKTQREDEEREDDG